MRDRRWELTWSDWFYVWLMALGLRVWGTGAGLDIGYDPVGTEWRDWLIGTVYWFIPAFLVKGLMRATEISASE